MNHRQLRLRSNCRSILAWRPARAPVRPAPGNTRVAGRRGPCARPRGDSARAPGREHQHQGGSARAPLPGARPPVLRRPSRANLPSLQSPGSNRNPALNPTAVSFTCLYDSEVPAGSWDTALTSEPTSRAHPPAKKEGVPAPMGAQGHLRKPRARPGWAPGRG